MFVPTNFSRPTILNTQSILPTACPLLPFRRVRTTLGLPQTRFIAMPRSALYSRFEALSQFPRASSYCPIYAVSQSVNISLPAIAALKVTGIAKAEKQTASLSSELEELALAKLLSIEELQAAGNQNIIAAIEPLSGSNKGQKLVFSAKNLGELKTILKQELQKQSVYQNEINRIIDAVQLGTSTVS